MLQKGSKLTPLVDAQIDKLWTNGTIGEAPEEVVQHRLLEDPDPEVSRQHALHQVVQTFFSPHDFRVAFPNVWAGFQVNLKLMVVAEALVLVFALAVAVVRGLPGRGAKPLRALMIVYTDFFRGTPLILVAFVIGFGLPALQHPARSATARTSPTA